MLTEIVFTGHYRSRMDEYGFSEERVREALGDPDEVVEGHSGRLVAHSRLNGKVLRVVFEEKQSVKTVVTVYPARADRYEV